MKNMVGQTPRGDDFYPRDSIISKIYRRLESGSHLFLSAPRRSGKTSIMRYMDDFPNDKYAFVYITVEDVEDVEEYFRVLSEELLESEALSKLVKTSKNVYDIIQDFGNRIKKVKIWEFEIETQSSSKPTYRQEFESLLKKLDTDGFTIGLLIDEFPVALENIAKKHGAQAAVEFLHANRTLRQKAKPGLLFIYTGSIGLPNIARKLDATATINDINVVEIPPLTSEEAKDLSEKLFKSYSIKCSDGAIDYMLSKIEWLMPFFVQLVVQMVIDEVESNTKTVSNKVIDQVLEKASNHRNNIYFENYYSRLQKTLPKEEAALAKKILYEIAHKGQITIKEAKQFDPVGNVLEILEFDGYINADQHHYRFNSPILRLWWLKFAQPN
jgi:hypothetical protein